MAIRGVTSPACFFARFAAFFSFGVSKDCFFTSLLDRWDLGMVLTLLNGAGKVSKARREEEQKGIYLSVPISPGLRDAATSHSV